MIALPGDRFEVPVDGRQIDLVRGALLIEIQTGSFSSLATKLRALLDGHHVHVVHPVALTRYVVRVDDDGNVLGRRRSPKGGQAIDACDALVSLRDLLAHPRLTLELVCIVEDEVRRADPARWRRHGFAVVERRLVSVIERVRFDRPHDLLALLPAGLPSPFTTDDVARAAGVPRDLAQRAAYCLRSAGVVRAIGKKGNAVTYVVVDDG